MRPDCVNCKFLSTETMHSVCQRATSEHYARKVLQHGVAVCSEWEHWTGTRLKAPAVVVKFPGAA